MKKRIVFLIIAMLFIAFSAMSCAENNSAGDSGAVDTPEETATEAADIYADDLPEQNFGRPALVWHAFTMEEFDVVCGYDNDTKQFVGRGTHKGNDDYAREP
jgi:hypothetical protein